MRRTARLLSFFGAVGAVLVLSKVHAAWVADPTYDYTGSFRFAWSLGYSAVLGLAAYTWGLPDVSRGPRRALAAAASASAAGAAAVSVVQLVVGDALLPRFVVFGAAVVVVPLQLLAWRLATHGRERQEHRDRLVVVGSATGLELDRLIDDLADAPEVPAHLAAHLEVLDASGPGIDEQPLVTRVMDERATVVVLDREALLDQRVVDQAAVLHESGIRIRTLLQFYEEWLGKLPLGELERASLFFDIGELHGERYARAKRVGDVVGGVIGLVPLGLSVPFVLIGNLVSNRGPLLYRQERVGQGGARFQILKFRTMVPTGPTVTDSTWTTVGDPRITPFGGLLRRTHVDELPQVVNILRGDLSLVGPRPEQPGYVHELSTKLPFYGMRHLVRPGLTGWAQVKYGYAGDERDAREKLQYEFFYLRNQGLAFDLRIIGRTLRSVLGGRGSGR
ncbi:MAG: sugar transferase [Actinobacteria bacterium]|nr:sugar transferase [Actinomycetota bacterium]